MKRASRFLSFQVVDSTRRKVFWPALSRGEFSTEVLNSGFGKSQFRSFLGTTSDESEGEEKEREKKIGRKEKAPAKGQSTENDEEDEKVGRWNSQLAWLNNILESALSLYKRVVPPDGSQKAPEPATTRSLVDIASNLHRSTTAGMQQWSLGELTFGLYLLSLHHAAENVAEPVEGKQVVSTNVVTDLIYHAELAKGAYMKNAAALARTSMLRESNVIKFMDKSSVMCPAYYIAVDTHEELIVLGIRGTSSVHDVITDLVSHSHEELKFDGGNVHFGTAKAAEWLIAHELHTLRQHLEKHSGFGLRLVGHSLGGATASLMAMMLRQKSAEELGFSPSIVTAVGFATPPCVSKSLAIQSADFVRTIILQDDVIPRVSATSLLRLRNEILGLDWANILRKEGDERKGVLDLVASTMQALSSVQDVARRYTAYASRLGPSSPREPIDPSKQADLNESRVSTANVQQPVQLLDELFAPGLLFHIRGSPIFQENAQKFTEGREGCTLWMVNSHEFLRRIVLTGSFFKDHKCDSYYQGLRDTIKGLPKA